MDALRDSDVAVIVPTYEHFDYAEMAIESAERTGATIILVDDASPRYPGDEYFLRWRKSPFIAWRFTKNGGLSRSWNQGLRMARDIGCTYAVCGNSDLLFSLSWFGPIREVLDGGQFDICGPVTNAPGHVEAQRVNRYTEYVLTDDLNDVDETQRMLSSVDPIPIQELNGFCLAAKVETWFRFEKRRGEVFDESVPLKGNESEFFRRVSGVAKPAIVPHSFVFHYRSVSRGLSSQKADRGWVRFPDCKGCG